MKLTTQELRDLGARMEHTIKTTAPASLQHQLAEYWLDLIKRRGKYVLKGIL